MPIFNPSSTTDQRCRTRQMQILSNHWSERYIRALKAILVKTTTLAISDYNFLSIRPLKERQQNKGVLIYNVMSGSLTLSYGTVSLNQSRHCGKLCNTLVPMIDFFRSSLVYSGSVLWNSLPASLISSETFKSGYIPYSMSRLVVLAC